MNIVKFTVTEKNGNKYEKYTKRLRNMIYFGRFFIYNYTLVQFFYFTVGLRGLPVK